MFARDCRAVSLGSEERYSAHIGMTSPGELALALSLSLSLSPHLSLVFVFHSARTEFLLRMSLDRRRDADGQSKG